METRPDPQWNGTCQHLNSALHHAVKLTLPNLTTSHNYCIPSHSVHPHHKSLFSALVRDSPLFVLVPDSLAD
ncbi:NADP-dependent alcohol dehydrogenase 6 [Fusarium oxysporum f. sp. albedinis]|nr:NADP-dependent alcohol dehydrogenase 6 [Fusarium oxysporum f. sp. albedinis]